MNKTSDCSFCEKLRRWWKVILMKNASIKNTFLRNYFSSKWLKERRDSLFILQKGSISQFSHSGTIMRKSRSLTPSHPPARQFSHATTPSNPLPQPSCRIVLNELSNSTNVLVDEHFNLALLVFRNKPTYLKIEILFWNWMYILYFNFACLYKIIGLDPI